MNIHSQWHVLVTCATAFYLIENYPLDVGPDFSASVIQVSSCGLMQPWPAGWEHLVMSTCSLSQLCGVMLSASEEATPSSVYHCVLRGLERLLLSEQLSRLDAESLVKLSVDRINVHSPHRALAALGLMLTCMYTGEQWAPVTREPLGIWSTLTPILGLWPSQQCHVAISGKEKMSPGRASAPSPTAPDSESVIVAMERVSVLFDR